MGRSPSRIRGDARMRAFDLHIARTAQRRGLDPAGRAWLSLAPFTRKAPRAADAIQLECQDGRATGREWPCPRARPGGATRPEAAREVPVAALRRPRDADLPLPCRMQPAHVGGLMPATGLSTPRAGMSMFIGTPT